MGDNTYVLVSKWLLASQFLISLKSLPFHLKMGTSICKGLFNRDTENIKWENCVKVLTANSNNNNIMKIKQYLSE